MRAAKIALLPLIFAAPALAQDVRPVCTTDRTTGCYTQTVHTDATGGGAANPYPGADYAKESPKSITTTVTKLTFTTAGTQSLAANTSRKSLSYVLETSGATCREQFGADPTSTGGMPLYAQTTRSNDPLTIDQRALFINCPANAVVSLREGQ